MKYAFELMILNKDVYIPFIIVFVTWLIVVCRRKYKDDELKGRMLKTGLLLFPASLLWIVVYYVIRLIIGYIFSYDVVSGIFGIAANVIVNAVFAAAIHRLFNSECLGKIKRIISVIVLFVLCTVELTVLIEILSGCTT